eukprot:1717877-Prymnesium_polylepis.1
MGYSQHWCMTGSCDDCASVVKLLEKRLGYCARPVRGPFMCVEFDSRSQKKVQREGENAYFHTFR